VDGVKKLTLKVPQRRPVLDYIKAQGRFRHLGEEDIAYIQAKVDDDYELMLAESEE
jgi:pyruvate ferredoxin oxidoreductase beta subunit